MELSIYNINGQQTGRTVSLPESVFAVTPNDHAIYLDVKQIMANKRQGTHKSKQRNEVSGSTRKLKKQKGTGGARAGSIKSPTIVGGGRIFGPQPRDYGFKLNKKVKRLARVSALTHKANSQALTVVEDFSFDSPKTKKYNEFLANFPFDGKKSLLILPEANPNLYLSSRNVQGAKVLTIDSINTYEILNADRIFIFENVVQKFENI
jgi:large subunit ribosomal protein L4